jgi:hypothetical protein
MELESIDTLLFGALLVVSVVAAYLATRRLCWSVFDYWVVIPGQQAFILAYSAYCYSRELIDASHFSFIVSSLVAFAAGTYVIPRRPAPLQLVTPQEASPGHLLFLRCTLYALCAQQGLGDLAFVAARGIPALSADGVNPSIYSGGFGVIKYIHDANIAGITCVAFLLLILAADRRSFFVGMAFVAYPQVLMEWSKSGLLYVPLLLYTMNRYSAQRFGRRVALPRRIALLAVPIALLFVGYKFAGVVAEGYEQSIPLAIAKRMVNTADSVFMYFQLDGYQYFEGEVKLAPYLLSHITPYFGITDVSQEFGVLLPQVTLGIGDQGYGPYPPFQIIGHLTMGWGGLLYAFAIGAILALIKRARIRLRSAAPYFVCMWAAPFLAGDSSLFVYSLSCQLFNLPAFAAAVAAYLVLVSTGRRAESQAPVAS